MPDPPQVYRLEDLHAATGFTPSKLEEGVIPLPGWFNWHYRQLSEPVIDWIRGMCRAGGGEVNPNLFSQWVCRVAWVGVSPLDGPESGAMRPIEREMVPFNGPSPDGRGFIYAATWAMLEPLMGQALHPILAGAVFQHSELTAEERAKLLFPVGSSAADSDAAESPTAEPATATAFTWDPSASATDAPMDVPNAETT